MQRLYILGWVFIIYIIIFQGKNVSLIQSTDSEIEVKFSKKLNIVSSSDENSIIKEKGEQGEIQLI